MQSFCLWTSPFPVAYQEIINSGRLWCDSTVTASRLHVSAFALHKQTEAKVHSLKQRPEEKNERIWRNCFMKLPQIPFWNCVWHCCNEILEDNCAHYNQKWMFQLHRTNFQINAELNQNVPLTERIRNLRKLFTCGMHSLFSYDSDVSKFIESYKLYSWTGARQLVTFTQSYRIVVFVNSVCLTCNRRQEENRKGKAARTCGNKQQWTSSLGRTPGEYISSEWIVLREALNLHFW